MQTAPIDKLAQKLNDALGQNGCVVNEMLSERGRRAYFPSCGILGQSAEAKGSTINATIGTAFENDGTPLCLECVEGMVNVPSTAFLYAPSSGDKQLRGQWQNLIRRKNPSLEGKAFSLPVVTNALTHALYLAGQLFIDRGDAVIIPDMYWDNYDLLFREGCGAKFKFFKTFSGRHFNVRALEKSLLSRGDKKIVLLNFPNNPTGYTPTEDEAAAIRDAILEAAKAGKKVVVLIDDAYFGLVYEKGVFTESIFALLADLHENVLAVKLDGATKEDYVWGVRVGFMTFAMKGLGPDQLKALEQKAAGLVRGTISSGSNIGQKILVGAYACPEYKAQKQAKFDTLAERYACIRKILRSHREYRESFLPMPFNSGYFMCVKPQGVDADALRRHLIEKYSTGTIMLDGMLRIAFSSVPCEKLGQLFANIDQAVRDLK